MTDKFENAGCGMRDEEMGTVLGGMGLTQFNGVDELKVRKKCSKCGRSFIASARSIGDDLCSDCKNHVIPPYMQP